MCCVCVRVHVSLGKMCVFVAVADTHRHRHFRRERDFVTWMIDSARCGFSRLNYCCYCCCHISNIIQMKALFFLSLFYSIWCGRPIVSAVPSKFAQTNNRDSYCVLLLHAINSRHECGSSLSHCNVRTPETLHPFVLSTEFTWETILSHKNAPFHLRRYVHTITFGLFDFKVSTHPLPLRAQPFLCYFFRCQIPAHHTRSNLRLFIWQFHSCSLCLRVFFLRRKSTIKTDCVRATTIWRTNELLIRKFEPNRIPWNLCVSHSFVAFLPDDRRTRLIDKPSESPRLRNANINKFCYLNGCGYVCRCVRVFLCVKKRKK